MYQKTYEIQSGTTKINISKAIAGKELNCRLTYIAGFYGIDDGGSFKITFKIASDFEKLQTKNPSKNNYLKITSNNKEIEIKTQIKTFGTFDKTCLRPWGKEITIYISGGYLKEYDKIFIQFKNWNFQTFTERKFEFRCLVDPFSIAKYIKIPSSPKIDVVNADAHRLKVIAPTKTQVKKQFQVLIKLEDEWGNPCIDKKGIFIITKQPGLKLSKTQIKFTKGKALLTMQTNLEKTFFISVKYKTIQGNSNPIISRKKYIFNSYWADLHGQSNETIGTNNVDNYF